MPYDRLAISLSDRSALRAARGEGYAVYTQTRADDGTVTLYLQRVRPEAEEPEADPFDGFPGADALRAAGYASPDALRQSLAEHEGEPSDALTGIDGIGPATADKILAALR